MMAHAGHDGDCDTRYERLVPEILSSMDVGKVNLNGFQTRGDHGVPQGYARVGKSPWVEDETGEACIAPFVNLVDQSTFVVGLERVHLAVACGGLGFYLILDLVEGHVAIDFRLAFSEAVEVGAIEQSDLFHLVLIKD